MAQELQCQHQELHCADATPPLSGSEGAPTQQQQHQQHQQQHDHCHHSLLGGWRDERGRRRREGEAEVQEEEQQQQQQQHQWQGAPLECSVQGSCPMPSSAPQGCGRTHWGARKCSASRRTHFGRAKGARSRQRACTQSVALLGAWLIAGAVAAGTAAAADLGPVASSMQTASSGAQQQGGGQEGPSKTMVPRVAIVSEKAFHLEVLAGFISILQPDFGRHMVVYMHQMNFENRHLDFGFGEFLQGEFDTMRIRALPWLGVPTFDVVVFLSPEYRVDFVKNFLDRCGAKLAIMMVHNGDARDVPLLLPLHPNAHLMTLSPHVQKFVQQRLNTSLIDWMLPLKALTPRKECAAANLTKCLSGFAIQGAMDSRRRNYTNIFHQLDTLINSSSTLRDDQRLRINVVGSGKPEKLGVPPHLVGRVMPHTNLRFQDFYELIHTNLALLPALASDSYYDRKFSSTLITSLVTGVPVVVDRKFLKSYTFLNDSHVVRQWRNDTLTDVLRRMLASSNEELLAVRRHVAGLRAELSHMALTKVKALLQPLLPQIQQEWERQPW